MNSANLDGPRLPDCFTSTIEHPHFTDCLSRLREITEGHTSTRIVLLTGPTGTGKSTVIEALKRELVAASAAERNNDPEMLPFGACAVSSRGQTAFSWKDTYIQLLRSLQHPFPETAVRSDWRPPAIQDIKPVLRTMSPESVHNISNDKLFRKLQTLINHRRPKALIFDEAHHLLRVASSQSLVNQLEHLKYIADETRTLHVLCGTYELIRFADLSGALIRRREVIHFQRYIYDPRAPAKTLEEFAKVVAHFHQGIAEMCNFDLLSDVPNLYQGSVGCIGVLRDWLCRAYERAKKASSKLTRRTLEETMLASRDRFQLLKEAQDGEQYFETRSGLEDEYLCRLGFRTAEPSATTNERQRRKAKPFERRPHNDPLGLEQLSARNTRGEAA